VSWTKLNAHRPSLPLGPSSIKENAELLASIRWQDLTKLSNVPTNPLFKCLSHLCLQGLCMYWSSGWDGGRFLHLLLLVLVAASSGKKQQKIKAALVLRLIDKYTGGGGGVGVRY
jgi:hypothetical protein